MLIEKIKFIAKIAIIIFIVGFVWNWFHQPPSTRSVCYSWSKATDQFANLNENSFDGAEWLRSHLKTEADFRAIDPDVLSAMKLYDEGGIIFQDTDPFERHGLRKFVLDACEKASKGSTHHSN